MGAIDERERLIADLQFGAGAVVINTVTYAPATWYLGLSRAAPNDDGSGWDEPTIGQLNYARVAVANNATNFPAAQTVGGQTLKRNGAPFTFAIPSGTWGLIGWWAWFTAATGGLPQFHQQLQTAITVQSGNNPVEFATQQLIMPWD